MKTRLIASLLLLASTYIHANTFHESGFHANTPIIELSPGQEYAFEITSSIKRYPVMIHYQNKKHAHIYCRRRNTKSPSTHRCKVIVDEDTNKEGTFAVFQRLPGDTERVHHRKVLFYVSITPSTDHHF